MTTSPIHTRIWREEAEPNNPFTARRALCHGYDVYGEMLGRARWADMILLLFRGEAPSVAAANLLDILAVALANAGPRDAAVHAAMCGGVGGSNAAASLMAALAAGAGQCGGAREVFEAMQRFGDCRRDVVAWQASTRPSNTEPDDVWPVPEHAPGFDPHGVSTSLIVRQTLAACVTVSPGPYLRWLDASRPVLEEAAGLPLALTGVAAAALLDLGLDPAAGEMLFLLLRLPGAAVHAIEQWGYGFKRFPFYPIELLDDPARNSATSP